MSRAGIPLAIAAFALLDATAGRAQEQETGPRTPSAEEMIEVAREAYRPPGLRRACRPGEAGEIVVCAPDPAEFRVSSPTDDAIRAGRAMNDGVARAPDVSSLPPCEVVGCIPIGAPPPPIYLIDLSAIPEPLPPEEAKQILRAEDLANPAEASPAAGP